MPQNADGGPPAGPAVEKQIASTTHDHSQDNGDGHRRRRDRLIAVGEYHPPVGRRRLGAVIVRRCPACRHLHQHKAIVVATADGSMRTGSCGAVYTLRVLRAPRTEGAA